MAALRFIGVIGTHSRVAIVKTGLPIRGMGNNVSNIHQNDVVGSGVSPHVVIEYSGRFCANGPRQAHCPPDNNFVGMSGL